MSMDQLRKLCDQAGVDFSVIHYAGETGSTHVRLRGKLVVDYWPFSKNRRAYVLATQRGVIVGGHRQAIELTKKPPPLAPGQRRSRNKGRRWKRAQFAKCAHQTCYWCGCPLTPATATVEHIIPLARGGLDHHNNYALACEPCNAERGHHMPEMK